MELAFEIDKITESIENADTGETLDTLVLPVTKDDLKETTKKNGWLFDCTRGIRSIPRRIPYQNNNRRLLIGNLNMTKQDGKCINLLSNKNRTQYTAWYR